MVLVCRDVIPVPALLTDVVLFIFREEKYKPTEENRGIAEIIIGKQRNGPTGMIKLAFIDSFTRFENLYRETE